MRAAVAGDKEARDEFAQMNLSLVWSVLKRFQSRGFEWDDLFQVGAIGLLKAIEKFDFSFGVQFSTYAVPMILGEIKRYMRDDGLIKVSRGLKETAIKAKKAAEDLRKEKGREPLLSEVAEYIGIATDDVVLALSAAQAPGSLFDSVGQEDPSGMTVIETVGAPENMEEATVDRLTVQTLLAELSPRENLIMRLRYFEHRTQGEIAQRIGVSQVQVSRLEKKTLSYLRERLREDTKNQARKPAAQNGG